MGSKVVPSSFHQNNGLIFQFILVHFCTAMTEVIALETALKKQGKGLEERVVDSFERLLGEPFKNGHYPWNSDIGLFFKLKNYCAALAAKSYDKDKEAKHLEKVADQVWKISREIQESTLDVKILSKILKLSAAMRRLARQIVQTVPQFRDDENVLYYLIKNQQQLDALFGNHFVVTLMDFLFPGGQEETERFLINRYTQRGFTQVLPTISNCLESIYSQHLVK